MKIKTEITKTRHIFGLKKLAFKPGLQPDPDLESFSVGVAQKKYGMEPLVRGPVIVSGSAPDLLDPDPVGSGTFWPSRIRDRIRLFYHKISSYFEMV